MSIIEQLYNNLSNQKKYNNEKSNLLDKIKSLEEKITKKREEQSNYESTSQEYIDLSFEIYDLEQQITISEEEIININSLLDDLKKESKELNSELPEDERFTDEQLSQLGEATQAGHIYPTVQVTFWTKKLNSYNTELDKFIERLDNFEHNASKEWVSKKVQKFCERINYALAWLRYYILKALQGAYKQAKKLLDIFSPILKIAQGGDIPETLTAILDWIKSVIAFFSKPYELIITFIQDVMTYTPPLITEATTLVTKVGTVPPKLVAKTIEIVGELSDEAVKNIDLKFEPISLGDVINGKEPEKPNKDDYIKK